MIVTYIAVLVYGSLATIAALVTAAIAGSEIGGALAFLSAGSTYLFQVLQIEADESRLIKPLWAIAILSVLASVAASLFGA